MRLLFLIFLTTLAGLCYLCWTQNPRPRLFPDGRLVASPVVPRYLTPGEPLLPAAPLPTDSAEPGSVAPTRLEVISGALASAVIPAVPRLHSPSRSDWGIAELGSAAPAPVASVVEPQPLTPQPAGAPGTGTAVLAGAHLPSAPGTAGPNLYLPEGAVNEAGARLTLIAAETSAHDLPDAGSRRAPFTLKEGDVVRPLTRLREEKDHDWIKFQRDGRDWWARAEYFIRVDPRNQTADITGNLEVGKEVVDRTSALPPAYCPTDLVAVPREFVLESREIRLRKEVVEALTAMARAAAAENLKVRVFSGYRDFGYQKRLYLEAIDKRGPKQNGVAAPGYSEHQLGTTIDVSGMDRRFILKGSFADTAEGKWLAANAARFGFRHSYTQENTDESGYKPEPWHLRYVGTATLRSLASN